MNKQLSHEETFSQHRKFSIILLADNVMGDANIGSLFRLADAFNIEKLVFCGSPINLENNRIKRTARATIKNIENEYWENSENALINYKTLGYKPLALEITKDSIPVDSYSFKTEDKILLVIGNERHGISNELLEQVDKKLHITMFGHNSSMNVSQATGIALYEITKTLPSLAN